MQKEEQGQSIMVIFDKNRPAGPASVSQVVNAVRQRAAHVSEGSTVAGLPNSGEGVTEPGQGIPSRQTILRAKTGE